MQKKTKIALVVGVFAIVLSFGILGGLQIMPKIDPPFTLINLIK